MYMFCVYVLYVFTYICMYVYIGMYARYMCTLCFLYVCIYIYVGICMAYISHTYTYIYIYTYI